MIKRILSNKGLLAVFLVALILFVIPFFWLSPGEMDLGGDSNRLFFYDPFSNLKAFSIYSVVPWGTGIVSSNQYFIPFLLFLTFLKSLVISPTILIGIFNGLKLSGSFIFVFLIIRELFLKQEKQDIKIAQFSSAIIGALFYTFSSSVIENMKYALVTHNQVFLNPMIFYLLLMYLTTRSLKYLWIGILITFVFSTNFSLQAPPPLFAFYPISLVFLLLYNHYVLQKSVPWKGIIFGALFFIGLHAFDLFPVINTVFDKGSEFNTRAFEGMSKQNIGLIGFNNVLSAGKVSEHILLPLSYENQKLNWSLIFIPLLTFLGLISIKEKNKAIPLVMAFFLITLFLISANVTNIGVEFYRKLFIIPGFGMFRIFYGQWQWVYTFFYSILIGLAISYFFSRIKKKYVRLVTLVVVVLLLLRSEIVFNGKIVNVYHRGTKNLGVVIRMDPNYERMVEYIKNIPNDGRILHMPFTDYGYGIVGGANRGAYVGHSMVSYLAGRADFTGYQTIDPFSEAYVKLVKEKNYSLIRKMMAFLQIRYVLYNSDEKVSDKYFTGFLYGYTGTPASSSSLLNFVKNISGKEIHKVGSYTLFEVEKENYLPHFYLASTVDLYKNNIALDRQYFKALSFFPDKTLSSNLDNRAIFLDRETCHEVFSKINCDRESFIQDIQGAKITYQKINPTKYRVKIENVKKPFLLVFQNQYSEHWKLYSSSSLLNTNRKIDSYYNSNIVELSSENEVVDVNPFETNGLKPQFDNMHIQVNGYANAWFITPSKGKKEYSFIVEMTSQKIFYYSFIVSVVFLIAFLLLGLELFIKKKKK